MGKEYNKISKLDKEIERLKSKPKDYSFDEAKKLLNKLGFYENNKGEHQVQEWSFAMRIFKN